MDTGEKFLYATDLALSFLWMCFSAFPSFLVLKSGEKGILRREIALVLFSMIYLLLVFIFNWLASLTNGAYNPVDVFSAAIDGDPSMFVRTVAGRIFAEVILYLHFIFSFFNLICRKYQFIRSKR